MNKDLELKLVRKYPIIFSQYGGDIRYTCMGWGMTCGDGWYNIINELCENVTTLIGDKSIKVTADQVKEKFGGLSFYYNIEVPETFMNNVSYIFRNAMFKTKLGRLYWIIVDFRKKIYRTTEEKIRDVIDDGQYKSYKTCELCGKPGKTRGQGWVSTQCKECWEKSIK